PCEGVDPNADVWEMTSLKLPAEGEVIGFNLDGLETAGGDKTPENGCGFTDLAGGVDNVVGVLLPVIGAIPGAEDIDIQAAIDGAIADGDLSIIATIKNYEGAGSTGVTLTLVLNGNSVGGLTDVPAT